MVFFLILMTVFALECLLSVWWLKRLWRHIPSRFLRGLLLAALGSVGVSLVWMIFARVGWLPRARVMTTLGMLWVVLTVPLGVLPCLLGWAAWDVARRLRRARPALRPHPEVLRMPGGLPAESQAGAPGAPALGWTRRQLLGTSLAAAPLLATYGAAGVGVAQAWNFRRRRLTVPVPGLPPALAGLRIVHVSDTHVGGFTPVENLGAVARVVAEEKPDLIAFTGDLIDHSNTDLPASLAFCEKLRQIAPLFFCEGNHDRIDDYPVFCAALARGHFNWLRAGDSRTLTLRGQKVQVIGASWSFKPATHAEVVAQAAAARRADAFPLLLVHHPDAFDPAAAAGFPLVLSGHTHGGQLMLTERLGAGPVMFNYWSGLYRKANASLVVSNGIGHWFPLRVNAPAEIGVLTLVRG